jgi:hypothetical protein
MACAALLIPVAGLTLGLSGTAGAATVKITCTTITGNISGDLTISGCTGGDTGGSSVPFSALALEGGGTTDWVSGSTTTVSAPVTTSIPATKCPGYTKPPKGTTPPEPIAVSVVSAVTADTGDSMLLPATSTGEVCVSTGGDVTVLKSFVYSFSSGSITCTSVNGTISGDLTVSGCTGGNTGGGSTSFSALALGAGGTIPWLSGGSTTIAAPTISSTSNKDCPGYSKPPKGETAPEPVAENFTAVITSDTGDGFKLPGTAKGSICIGTDGNTITALKPLTAK